MGRVQLLYFLYVVDVKIKKDMDQWKILIVNYMLSRKGKNPNVYKFQSFSYT